MVLTLSHGNLYMFYEVANQYDLTRVISLNPSDGCLVIRTNT